MFYGMDPTIILLIPAILFTVFAQGKVKNAYARYSRIPTRRGMTGGEVARRILDSNGMSHVPIEIIPGQLTDNYDPTKDVMHLSEEVCNGNSIASVSIAAHESGHAIQDAREYSFLKLRVGLVPAVNMVSVASWPLIIIGIMLVAAGSSDTAGIGNMLLNLGIIAFCVVVLFHTITLPVEFNASSRALKQLQTIGAVDGDELRGAKKVLSAAAMTYVAALAVSVMNLIRILMIRGSNN